MPKRSDSQSSSSDQSSQSQQLQYISVAVSQLTPNVTKDHLNEIFSHFGTVLGVQLKKGPKLTSSALLKFEKKQQAELAITHMNDGYIDGSKIKVESELKNVTTKQQRSSQRHSLGRRKQYSGRGRKISKDRHSGRRQFRQSKDRRRYDRNRDSRKRKQSVSSSSSSSSAIESSDSGSNSSSSDS